MDKQQAVRRMQDYIEKHYLENITIGQLADAACYSPWYSYRIFIELVNLTPADYIRRLKLSKSALELRDQKVKIIDIAYKYGYESVDGYQRSFHKEFGVNPYEYSKNPIPICLFIPYKIMEKGEKRMKEVKTVFVSLIEKPKRKAIIKRGIKATEYFDYCYEVGCDVWGIASSIKSLSGEALCMWLPKHLIKENTSVYVQGAEVESDYKGVIPEGFDVIDLPCCKYIMFQSEPFEEEYFEEAIYEVREAIKKYNPQLINYEWDEDNPRIQLEPIGEKGYRELLPVKNKKI